MWVFIILAAIGMLLSVAVHVSTYFGVDPQEVWPAVWLLHLGIFVVFIPAVIVQNAGRRGTGKASGGRGVKGPLDDAPRWIRWGVGALFVYAILNFIVFAVRMDGQADVDPKTGGYYLRHKATFVRTLTAAEYHHYRALEARGFSGHWMMLYAVAGGILLWARRRPLTEFTVPLHAPPVLKAGALGAAAAPAAAVPAAAVPAAAVPLTYGRAARRSAPIWLHQTLILASRVVGWMGTPLLIGMLVLPRLPSDAGLLGPFLCIVGAILGATVPAMLIQRRLAARCPACGGRAMWRATDPLRYQCADCGRVHGPT